MPTARDVIKRSYRLLAVKAAGESLTGDEGIEALEVLNSILDYFNTQRLMIPAMTKVTHTLVPSTGTYTIGSGATINTTRPQKVESAYITDSNSYDHVMTLVDNKYYSEWYDKTEESDYPDYLYYEPSITTGTIYLLPVPSAAHTLNLQVWSQLTSIANLSTTFSFPPGYQAMVEFNLAEWLAPEFGVKPPALVSQKARETLKWVKTINMRDGPRYKCRVPGRGYNLSLGDKLGGRY